MTMSSCSGCQIITKITFYFSVYGLFITVTATKDLKKNFVLNVKQIKDLK